MKHEKLICWYLAIDLLFLLLLLSLFGNHVEAVKVSKDDWKQYEYCHRRQYPIIIGKAQQHDDKKQAYCINRGGGGGGGKRNGATTQNESNDDNVPSPSSLSSSNLKAKATTTTTPIVEGLKNSLASGLASCCAKTLLQPFDTIKTMQQHYKTDTNNNGDHHHQHHHRGGGLSLMEAYELITERGGFQQLYAGLVVSALGSVPSIGLYYGVYSYCKRILIPYLQNTYGSNRSSSSSNSSANNNNNNNNKTKNMNIIMCCCLSDDQLKWIAIIISAAIGNTVASFSRVPYEVVKQKLQTGIYPTTYIAITTIYNNQGIIGGFFPTGGIWIQMLRDIPYAIFTLLSYEILQDKWVQTKHDDNNNNKSSSRPWHDMIAGAIAGGIGSYMTNGLDVIKTRIQTNPELYNNGSILNCISVTWEEGGYRAFMRGCIPRLLHKIPSNGCFFLFYEFFRRLLRVGDNNNINR